MKEYPISFLVRLQPKHKNIIKKIQRELGKVSEAEVIRLSLECANGEINALCN